MAIIEHTYIQTSGSIETKSTNENTSTLLCNTTLTALSKLYTAQVVYEVSPGLFHQSENSWKRAIRTSNNCRTLTYPASQLYLYLISESGWRLAYSSLLAWASTRYERQLVIRLQSFRSLNLWDLDCEMSYSMSYNIRCMLTHMVCHHGNHWNAPYTCQKLGWNNQKHQYRICLHVQHLWGILGVLEKYQLQETASH